MTVARNTAESSPLRLTHETPEQQFAGVMQKRHADCEVFANNVNAEHCEKIDVSIRRLFRYVPDEGVSRLTTRVQFLDERSPTAKLFRVGRYIPDEATARRVLRAIMEDER